MSYFIDKALEILPDMLAKHQNNYRAVGAEAANATFTEARTTDGLLSICAGAQDRPLVVW